MDLYVYLLACAFIMPYMHVHTDIHIHTIFIHIYSHTYILIYAIYHICVLSHDIEQICYRCVCLSVCVYLFDVCWVDGEFTAWTLLAPPPDVLWSDAVRLPP